MGGGAVANVVRKRKRKTRSERNHLRLSQMDQDKRGEKGVQKKNDEAPSSPCYSLRSSKTIPPAVSLPPAPREVRLTRNITQGRLTMGLFPYSKSSDCIKRGAIPETASVKKKVEEDLRRIINPSPGFVAESGGDGQGKCVDSGSKKKLDTIITTMSNSDQHNSIPCYVLGENDKTGQISSTSMVAPTAADSQMETGMSQNSPPQPSSPNNSVDTSSKVKGCSRSRRSTSTSTISRLDTALEKVLPVNQIAHKILANLKPQFRELFPTRDLNTELNADLKKLLKQSSGKVCIPDHSVLQDTILKGRLQRLPDQQEPPVPYTMTDCTMPPFPGYPHPFRHDSLSTSNPTHYQQSGSIGDTCDQSETAIAAQNLLSYGGFINSDKPPSIPCSASQSQPQQPLQYFIATHPSCHHQPQQEGTYSKTVRFVFASNGDSGNDDGSNTTNVVLEANRPLNHQHQQQPHQKHCPPDLGNSNARNSHSFVLRHPNSTAATTEPSTTKSLGFILPNAFGDGCDDEHDPDKPIIINIDRQDGEDGANDEDDSRLAVAKYNSFMASARSLKAKLDRQNECKRIIDSDKYSSPGSLSAFGIRRSRPWSHAFIHHTNQADSHHYHPDTRCNHSNSDKRNHHHHHHYHLRSQSTNVSAIPNSFMSGMGDTGAIPRSGFNDNNLAQSRNRLKTALDSIFMASSPNRSTGKQTSSNNFTESMDWQDVDILTTDVFPHAATSTDVCHNDDVYKQPLDQLRVHQSDMQHQARTFLDQSLNETMDQHRPSHSPPPPYHHQLHQHHRHSMPSTSCPTETWL